MDGLLAQSFAKPAAIPAAFSRAKSRPICKLTLLRVRGARPDLYPRFGRFLFVERA
jgi:hypothetical protein